jgi:DNA helicase-2/ATP-dependent DNA helicase PcrA
LPDDPLLASLNDSQRAAVVHGEGPLLVLAGAGSGKTRVITHRIAFLVQRRGVPPWRILAVTFTNKAAGEMRERVETLLGPAGTQVRISTFHAAGAAILRREAEKIGRTRSLVIYDDADQLTLLRRIHRELGLPDRAKPALLRHRIDRAKNHAQGPEELRPGPHDLVGNAVQRAYAEYQKRLAQADALDFGDLLLLLVTLFRKDRETLERYRSRFRWVLVDEFQDTNPVQYALLKLLCPKEQSNLCVVGDDDQSIYRWRGADVSNLLSFERDFPGAVTVKLERNYRSDAGILEAAYAVIRKNPRRKEKRLWTDRPRGALLGLILAPNERAEAQQIAGRMRGLADEGIPYSEMAAFFRVNAQSRVLEEALRLAGVPYHVVRGRAFYDRAEIKDAASYLRLAVNPRSDADLERVINTPPRGIGETSFERLQDHARSAGICLYDALAQADQVPGLAPRARTRLSGFRRLLDELIAQTSAASEAHTAVRQMLELSGMLDFFEAEGSEESRERAENLRELEGAALEFDRLRSEQEAVQVVQPSIPVEQGGALEPPQTALGAFLEQISLIGDADNEAATGRVSLMTLHAAKGLEFDAVFMTGMEEGVFPHARASQSDELGMTDPEEMAEERRLCYVGITRARKRLFFSLGLSRSLFGDYRENPPSRFLADIPRELFETGQEPLAEEPREERLPGETWVEREVELAEEDGFELDQRPESERQREPSERSRAVPPMRRRASGPALVVGVRVRHERFGEGLVTACSGSGPDSTITVRFPGQGEKRIVARFLTAVGD